MSIKSECLTPSGTAFLCDVKKLLQNEDNWCQDVAARAKDGTTAFWYSPSADSFCLSGAIQKVGQNWLDRGADAEYTDGCERDARIALRNVVGDIIDFNDSDKVGHNDIMTALRIAISNEFDRMLR